MDQPARVLIVDDSRLFRTALERALSGLEGISLAGSVHSGLRAMDLIREHPPDLVTLDFEMPGQDGLVTLKQIMDFNASRKDGKPVGVVMLSSHTRAGAEISMKAIELGAYDFLPKPTTPDPESGIKYLREQLLPRIRAFLRNRGEPTRASGLRLAVKPAALDAPAKPTGQRTLRAILVAVSTGGPRALNTLLPGLKGIRAPILIVQHMPPDFTHSLAQSLSRTTGLQVVEATDNEPLRPGVAYLAPGGRHLVVRNTPGLGFLAGLSDLPPEEGCRPSANYLFRTGASVFGPDCAGLILTGMGRDGVQGLASLKRQGALILAQDEASSTVWGMPGAAVQAGLADMVLPLDQMAGVIQSIRGPGDSRRMEALP